MKQVLYLRIIVDNVFESQIVPLSFYILNILDKSKNISTVFVNLYVYEDKGKLKSFDMFCNDLKKIDCNETIKRLTLPVFRFKISYYFSDVYVYIINKALKELIINPYSTIKPSITQNNIISNIELYKSSLLAISNKNKSIINDCINKEKWIGGQ